MKKNNLIIIGAGGHGRVVKDIALSMKKFKNILFLDDNPPSGVSVAGKVLDYEKYLDNAVFVVGIGNNEIRKRIFLEIKEKGGKFVTLVHSSAVIGENVDLGNGSVIMPGVVINNGATFGDGVIVNTCSSIDHDCVIESFAHVSVGVHLAGTVKVGDSSLIGVGAIVINNITIAQDTIVSAGAVVVKDLLESGTYVGIPAKKI